ncbi:morphogenetic protein [Pantoea anthophila]|uniref:morphogenetic protein n=1 Tax=Pantoea anthophila TaxID=470931 RepID=UPI00277D9518|nr:morphogenetic protein [Pantoea anthophila]MDQ1214549.1 hypothetical protein [Pantoea anthophila]
MRERPIIFNADMVRAVLDGRKTQTRRIIQERHLYRGGRTAGNWPVHMPEGEEGEKARLWAESNSPFGAVGDRLWVRETWARYNIDQNSHDMAYRATTPEDWPKEGRWRPSIHMPRWASRITLEITDVRVERLHAITLGDICKEFGCGLYDFRPATYGFTAWEELWKSIYGDDSWQANPWVWVIEFKSVEGQE